MGVDLGIPPMLRLLHTADWHLGKPFDERGREPEHLMFLDFLLEQIVTKRIDALLVSGDVFDSANPSQRAMGCYYDFLSHLRRVSQCQVVIIAGNHDSPALLEAPRELLQSLDIHVVGKVTQEPILIPVPNDENPLAYVAAVPFLRDGDLRTGVSGQSAAEIQESLNNGIAKVYEMHCLDRKRPLLAMGHLTVIGSSKSSSERDIHIGGLGALPASRFPQEFCYVALGHLHRPQICGKLSHIRYSGSPIPLSFSEADDRKEIRYLEINEHGLQSQCAIQIPDFRRLIRIQSETIDALEWMKCIQADLLNRPSQLPAWVEIQLTKSFTDVELQRTMDIMNQAVDPISGGNAQFEIVRILPVNGAAQELPSESSLEVIVGMDSGTDPVWMFERRLTIEKSLDEPQLEILRNLFQMLLEKYQQTEATKEAESGKSIRARATF